MQFNEKVQAALRHVHSVFPEVTQVFYGADGRWLFCNDDFDAPNFDKAPGKVDIGLLEDAADAADNHKGFPCAYRLLTLADYYYWWDRLGDVPTADGHFEYEDGAIEQPFLDFPAGTHREEIWRWFEAQHPEFVVGEVMQGIRKSTAESSWAVTLTMENGTKFDWTGEADDQDHAEGQAIAEAVAKTGEQVLEVVGVQQR